jgi:hypothetical protein
MVLLKAWKYTFMIFGCKIKQKKEHDPEIKKDP